MSHRIFSWRQIRDLNDAIQCILAWWSGWNQLKCFAMYNFAMVDTRMIYKYLIYWIFDLWWKRRAMNFFPDGRFDFWNMPSNVFWPDKSNKINHDALRCLILSWSTPELSTNLSYFEILTFGRSAEQWIFFLMVNVRSDWCHPVYFCLLNQIILSKILYDT